MMAWGADERPHCNTSRGPRQRSSSFNVEHTRMDGGYTCTLVAAPTPSSGAAHGSLGHMLGQSARQSARHAPRAVNRAGTPASHWPPSGRDSSHWRSRRWFASGLRGTPVGLRARSVRDRGRLATRRRGEWRAGTTYGTAQHAEPNSAQLRSNFMCTSPRIRSLLRLDRHNRTAPGF